MPNIRTAITTALILLWVGIAFGEQVESRALLPGTLPPEKLKRRVSGSVSVNEVSEIKQKLNALNSNFERLDAEMEVMRQQHRMMIHRTNVGFLDQFYMKGGVALVLPRSRTFSFRTDSGLGAFVGLGQYFGRSHVADLSFDWDVYPSLSVRYRYEIHSESPQITWGPVIGVKVKMANLRPFDNFLDKPDEVASRFYLFGAILGFPMGRSLVTAEFLYLTNDQAFFFTNIALHFFL